MLSDRLAHLLARLSLFESGAEGSTDEPDGLGQKKETEGRGCGPHDLSLDRRGLIPESRGLVGDTSARH